MVNQQNPDWHIVGNGHDPTAIKVGAIMCDSLMFWYEDGVSAERLMEERGLSYLPVVGR